MARVRRAWEEKTPLRDVPITPDLGHCLLEQKLEMVNTNHKHFFASSAAIVLACCVYFVVVEEAYMCCAFVIVCLSVLHLCVVEQLYPLRTAL